MKLSNLIERDEPVRSEDLEKRTFEEFNQSIKKTKGLHFIHKEITIPEGRIHVQTIFEPIPEFDKNSDSYGTIEFGIDFMPNMDPKPVIPRNFLAIGIESFFNDLRDVNPDVFNKPSVYSEDFLHMYTIGIFKVSIFPANGVLRLNDLIDRSVYNIKVKGQHPLSIILSKSDLLNSYTFGENDLPTFSDDYTSYMAKLVKKARTVYKALSVGTWKGHRYQLPKSDGYMSEFTVHQDLDDYTLANKVIHPNFSVSTNFGWEFVDGVKVNDKENPPLTEEELTEFRKYLKSRFKEFDIKYL